MDFVRRIPGQIFMHWGVTMNELLTGSYPNKRMPDGKLGRIIAKSTHMDPEQRYQTVEELEYDLNHEAGERKKFQSKKQYYPPGFRTGTCGRC